MANEVWAYHGGVSGTITIVGVIVGIAAYSAAGGSMTINGGDSVPIPAGVQINLTPAMRLGGPVLVFSGTDSYFVEYMKP